MTPTAGIYGSRLEVPRGHARAPYVFSLLYSVRPSYQRAPAYARTHFQPVRLCNERADLNETGQCLKLEGSPNYLGPSSKDRPDGEKTDEKAGRASPAASVARAGART